MPTRLPLLTDDQVGPPWMSTTVGSGPGLRSPLLQPVRERGIVSPPTSPAVAITLAAIERHAAAAQKRNVAVTPKCRLCGRTASDDASDSSSSP